MGGSSKKVTVGYKYYLGMHMVLCHGPVDYLSRIRVDDRNAWIGVNTGGPLSINKPGLFGGEDREGGVSGTVDMEFGEPTQGQNAYLQTRLGTDIPGFRGVVSAVLNRMYLGMNPYLKPWAFRLSRVHTRQTGIPQWYDETAEIKSVSYRGFPFTTVWDYYTITDETAALGSPSTVTLPSSGFSQGQAPFGDLLNTNFNPTTPIYPKTMWDNQDALWVRKEVEVFGRFEFLALFIRIENACYVYWDGVYVGAYNPSNTQIPEFREQTIIIPSENATPGTHTIHVYCLDEAQDLGETTDGTYFAATLEGWSTVDMNPAHIIRECLTDPVWGMGYLDADIDETSFVAAADKLFLERMGISLVWDRQMAIEDFVSEILRHIDASLYVDRITGKFTLKLVRYDYDESTLLELNETNIKKVTDYNRMDPGDAVNSVTVVFWDSVTGENGTVTADDVALIQAYGAVVNTTIQYPGFTNAELAGIAAARDLYSLSSPLLTCKIEANREASDLNMGDVFKFYYPDYHDGYILMRVNQISLGDGKKNTVSITCTEDVFATPESVIVGSETEGWVEPGGSPSAPPTQLVEEAPYYEMVQSLGQTGADNILNESPEVGYTQVAANRPEFGINAKVWIDDGSGYEDSAALDFAPSGKLVSNVGRLDTSWTLYDMEDLELVEVGTHGQVGDELIRVDSIDPATGALTVGRAVLDSVPATHAADSVVLFWDNYTASDQTEYVQGESINIKVLTNTSEGSLALVDGSESTLVLNARGIRPYRPAKLALDGNLDPSESLYPAYPVTITWVERNRQQETSGNLLDWEDATITPELGTSYRVVVDVLQEDKTFIANVNDTTTTGTSFEITEALLTPTYVGSPFVRCKVITLRNGWESFNASELVFRGPFSEPTNPEYEYRSPQAPIGITSTLIN